MREPRASAPFGRCRYWYSLDHLKKKGECRWLTSDPRARSAQRSEPTDCELREPPPRRLLARHRVLTPSGCCATKNRFRLLQNLTTVATQSERWLPPVATRRPSCHRKEPIVDSVRFAPPPALRERARLRAAPAPSNTLGGQSPARRPGNTLRACTFALRSPNARVRGPEGKLRATEAQCKERVTSTPTVEYRPKGAPYSRARARTRRAAEGAPYSRVREHKGAKHTRPPQGRPPAFLHTGVQHLTVGCASTRVAPNLRLNRRLRPNSRGATHPDWWSTTTSFRGALALVRGSSKSSRMSANASLLVHGGALGLLARVASKQPLSLSANLGFAVKKKKNNHLSAKTQLRCQFI